MTSLTKCTLVFCSILLLQNTSLRHQTIRLTIYDFFKGNLTKMNCMFKIINGTRNEYHDVKLIIFSVLHFLNV